MSMSWINMMFAAPLIGVRQRWPNVLHAITLDGVGATMVKGRTFPSACGLKGLRLVEGRYTEAPDEMRPLPALWPPRIKGMPENMTRCRSCWEETGKQRPRSDWVPNFQSSGFTAFAGDSPSEDFGVSE